MIHVQLYTLVYYFRIHHNVLFPFQFVFIPVFVFTHESLPYTYILIGISSGGIFTVLLPYIREITTIRVRGFCLTMTTVMVLAGYQLRAVVPELYDPMTFLVLGLVAVQLILMMCIVESPSYLVMVGKPEVRFLSFSITNKCSVDINQSLIVCFFFK